MEKLFSFGFFLSLLFSHFYVTGMFENKKGSCINWSPKVIPLVFTERK
jgi:hypothetical protein